MKKIIAILIILNSLTSRGQSYVYKPLDLDTSSYWVHNFYFYYGQPYYECHAEKISKVEKDTIIGAFKFHKLITYTSEVLPSAPQQPCELLYMKEHFVRYIREDTIAHLVIDNFNNILMDFNANVGDTIDMGIGAMNPVVDSISIKIINGIDRKIKWCHWGPNSKPFETIEGIGASFNFPDNLYGEWQIPCYEMVCFNKKGVKLFPNDSTTLCPMKPPAPVSIEDVQIESLKYKIYNKQLIVESDRYPVFVCIHNMIGNTVLNRTITDKSPIDLYNYKPSIYILSINNTKKKLIDKIKIEY